MKITQHGSRHKAAEKISSEVKQEPIKTPEKETIIPKTEEKSTEEKRVLMAEAKALADEKKKEYTQIYNAEIIPDISNDFFLIFMRKFDIEDYFLFDKKDNKKDEKNDVKTELKNLYQHLCFWLYEENHVVSMLYLIPKNL